MKTWIVYELVGFLLVYFLARADQTGSLAEIGGPTYSSGLGHCLTGEPRCTFSATTNALERPPPTWGMRLFSF